MRQERTRGVSGRARVEPRTPTRDARCEDAGATGTAIPRAYFPARRPLPARARPEVGHPRAADAQGAGTTTQDVHAFAWETLQPHFLRWRGTSATLPSLEKHCRRWRNTAAGNGHGACRRSSRVGSVLHVTGGPPENSGFSRFGTGSTGDVICAPVSAVTYGVPLSLRREIGESMEEEYCKRAILFTTPRGEDWPDTGSCLGRPLRGELTSRDGPDDVHGESVLDLARSYVSTTPTLPEGKGSGGECSVPCSR